MDIGQIHTLRRLTLLLTVVGAMLLAFSAVVLAQQERTAPAASESGTPPETPTAEIPDNYIVVLKDDDAGQDPEQVTHARARRGGQDPNRVADDQAQRHGLRVRHVYQNAIKGYSAVIPEGELQEVEDDPRVAFVEPDKEVRATRKKKKKQQQQNLPWGINRIDADVSSTKAGNGSGAVSDVNAYIIDTGLRNHEDLNVTDSAAFNATDDAKDYDCDGHGTHVAGTVAAKDNSKDVVSPAPGVPLTGVKVLNCDGRGSTSGVIAGVDWVTTNAKRPAIANMSLGGGASEALDKAVRRSAAKGVFYSISAGNDGDAACDQSPARAGKGSADPTTGEVIDENERDNGIVTVAATNNNDAEASFSNYGDCVDIWAPGVDVSSTAMGGGRTKMSGTSMASPHVGGTAALYLSQNASVSVTEIERRLKDDSFDTGTKSKDRRTLIKRLYAGSY
jgi:subtilisin family serine protease